MIVKFNEKYDKILHDMYKTYSWRISQHLNKPEFKYLINYVNSVTPKLVDSSFSFATKLYWTLNHLTDFPECQNPNCHNKLTKNISIKYGYQQKYCSRKCLNSDQAKKDLVKQTCLEKYGVENPFQSKEIQQKINITQQQKYNGLTAKKAPEVKAKQIQSMIDRYGVEYPLQNSDILAKSKQTCLKRYGAENAYAAESIKEKIKSEWKKNGYDHPMHSDKIKHQLQKQHYQQFKDFIDKNESDHVKLLSSIDEMVDHIFRWKCLKCGNIFESQINPYFQLNSQHIHGRCPKCYPISNVKSVPEYDVKEYLSSVFNGKIITSSRSIIPPKEIDIYIPDKSIAIELDGLYWHADDIGNDKNYHLHKTEECEKIGIHLIHIFENEWKLKQNIVKSRLNNLLGIYSMTIFARKCQIKNVESQTSRQFQDNNHIQGKVNASVNIGLFYNDELISLMTFGKCRFNKKYEWELLRFCNKLGYHIPGAAGKLLKFFERNYHPKSLISYADRRWSQGKLYNALGFELDHISKPDYWYFKNLILESRIRYQKHKLKEILDKFDDNKTEVENMIDNGYHRIFDCGNLVYVKKYES